MEATLEVREDEVDGGFAAVALGHSIATEGETLEELIEMVRDAAQCHFGDGGADGDAQGHPSAFCQE